MRTATVLFLFTIVSVGLLVPMPGTAGQSSVPMLINYQGELTAADGSPLPDGSYEMVFRIYDGAGSVEPLWEERYFVTDGNPVKVRNGNFSVLLGSGLGDTLSATLFDLPEAWLEIEVNKEVMAPRQRISSAAYAMRAEDARFLQGHTPSYFAQADHTHFGETWTTAGTCLTLEGTSRGLSASASGSTSSMFRLEGIYGYAENTGAGAAYGGYFTTGSSGTGDHFGLNSYAEGNSSSAAYGILSRARNEGNGEVCGGCFTSDTEGAGVHYGAKTIARAASVSDTYGLYSYGKNTSGGTVYGGLFEADEAGTGLHYGVYATASGNSGASVTGTTSVAVNSADGHAYGLFASAEAGGAGDAYGAWLQVPASGTGDHYGLYAVTFGDGDADTYGIYGYAKNDGSGSANAGYFQTAMGGTGQHTGVLATAEGESDNAVVGVYGSAWNPGEGNAYGGYFTASHIGEGNKYAMYAQILSGTNCYAGKFVGGVVVEGDLQVTGTKNAVVETDAGQYRKLYCMESAEMWLEDFGTGSLDNGAAVIEIEPVFAQTANMDVPYHVFLTPEGDCNGLYVTSKTPTSFEVRELQGGTSDISFSYRIVGKRKGYEKVRLETAELPKDEPPPELPQTGDR